MLKFICYTINAFNFNSTIKSITLPSTINTINENAFSACLNLETIDLSNCTNLTSIGYMAFSGCRGLTSITLPESLASIEAYAFNSCSGLTSISLPSSLTSIGDYAFSGCDKLSSATFENTTGWYVTEFSFETSGTPVDVTNPSTNASNLTGQYRTYYWKRNV